MKNSLLTLSVCAIGLSGCLTEQPVAKITEPKAADGSSYCFVGMD